MSLKISSLATLFAAGAFAATASPTLGAYAVSTSARSGEATLEASGSCGGKEVKDDKKTEEGKTEVKKDGKKDGSCGTGSCGAKKKEMKKGDKKEGSCGAKK
jgi:hypothetical protein